MCNFRKATLDSGGSHVREVLSSGPSIDGFVLLLRPGVEKVTIPRKSFRGLL